ncbi:uncharacterized protein LOC121929770 isoform X2 [Sceloporus undulatus]|uniref:uncharacterized protein LOC121929770 isoform X2 n=1 Tax=Sceloporus undulatus TaxID=8520 RepID=UPI001C4D38D6|nr:uncharacterized protein LOC121929770 isoform X2 [Sceloporus undulatus]
MAFSCPHSRLLEQQRACSEEEDISQTFGMEKIRSLLPLIFRIQKTGPWMMTSVERRMARLMEPQGACAKLSRKEGSASSLQDVLPAEHFSSRRSCRHIGPRAFGTCLGPLFRITCKEHALFFLLGKENDPTAPAGPKDYLLLKGKICTVSLNTWPRDATRRLLQVPLRKASPRIIYPGKEDGSPAMLQSQLAMSFPLLVAVVVSSGWPSENLRKQLPGAVAKALLVLVHSRRHFRLAMSRHYASATSRWRRPCGQAPPFCTDSVHIRIEGHQEVTPLSNPSTPFPNPNTHYRRVCNAPVIINF